MEGVYRPPTLMCMRVHVTLTLPTSERQEYSSMDPNMLTSQGQKRAALRRLGCKYHDRVDFTMLVQRWTKNNIHVAQTGLGQKRLP